MDIVQAVELAQRYEELIERAASDERIVLTYAGKQVALVSFDDFAFLEEVDRELDLRDAEEVKRRIANPAEESNPFVPRSGVEHSAR